MTNIFTDVQSKSLNMHILNRRRHSLGVVYVITVTQQCNPFSDQNP